MDYDRGNHVKYLISYHIILVTKYRHNILSLIDIKSIFKYIESISEFKIEEMEIDKKHIHILIKTIPKYSISSIINRLKQISTFQSWKLYNHILSQYYWNKKILWSRGYFVCSIGNVSKDTIISYIQSQG
jgi:putative transposase